MKRLILLLALALLSAPAAYASRGFGTTSGTASTDIICSTKTSTLTGSMSYSLWIFKNAAATSNARIWDSTTNSTAGTGDTLFESSGSSPEIMGYTQLTSGGTATWTFPNNTFSATGVWYNIVMTYVQGQFNTPTAYVNGAAVSLSHTVFAAGTAAAGQYCLGNIQTATNLVFNGRIAEFAVWNGQILTANEAKALALGASPLRIRPTALSLYLPLLASTSGEPDWASSHATQTVTGARFQPHPPAQPYPYGPFTR